MEAQKLALTLFAMLALGLFALAFEWFRDRGRHWLLLIGVALTALMFAVGCVPCVRFEGAFKRLHEGSRRENAPPNSKGRQPPLAGLTQKEVDSILAVAGLFQGDRFVVADGPSRRCVHGASRSSNRFNARPIRFKRKTAATNSPAIMISMISIMLIRLTHTNPRASVWSLGASAL